MFRSRTHDTWQVPVTVADLRVLGLDDDTLLEFTPQPDLPVCRALRTMARLRLEDPEKASARMVWARSNGRSGNLRLSAPVELVCGPDEQRTLIVRAPLPHRHGRQLVDALTGLLAPAC